MEYLFARVLFRKPPTLEWLNKQKHRLPAGTFLTMGGDPVDKTKQGYLATWVSKTAHTKEVCQEMLPFLKKIFQRIEMEFERSLYGGTGGIL